MFGFAAQRLDPGQSVETVNTIHSEISRNLPFAALGHRPYIVVLQVRMVFFDSTGSEDLFWSHFEIFHIRKIHYFSLSAPKLVKSLSNHHKSKVHEISDRFSGAQLFLTPPEH